jgi:hypothetical protein
MILKIMIPSAITDIINTLEFEDDGFFSIQAAIITVDNLELSLKLNTGETGSPTEEWLIKCSNVRSEKIGFECFYNIEEPEEHVLLFPYTKKRGSLFFSELSTDSKKIIGDLFLAHQEIMGDWYNFQDFLNQSIKLDALCSSYSGCLAEGPLPLLEEYKKVIARHGGKSNIINIAAPKRWNGSYWEEESSENRLLLMGEFFIVAQSFCYEQVSKCRKAT